MSEYQSESMAPVYELRAKVERQTGAGTDQVFCRANLNSGFGTPIGPGVDFFTPPEFAESARKLLATMTRKLP